jgi:hypothetical protein
MPQPFSTDSSSGKLMMLRRLQFLIVATSIVVSLGCDSAEPAEDAPSMDEMAAMLKQAPKSSDNTATATDSSRSSGTVAVASGENAASKPDPGLAARRGFALHDLSNEAAYVLVKADAAKVADAVAKQLNGHVTRDAYGKSLNDEAGTIVYQLAGHPWSIYTIMPDDKFGEQAAALSLELGTDVLTFASSDFNGWSFVALYRAGDEVEAIDWGGEGDELGADADLSKWDSHGIVSHVYDGIEMNDSFLFRSKLRKATEQELAQGEAFIDATFKTHDAYLPDVDDMPWVGENGIGSPLGPSAFAGVHSVTLSE